MECNAAKDVKRKTTGPEKQVLEVKQAVVYT